MASMHSFYVSFLFGLALVDFLGTISGQVKYRNPNTTTNFILYIAIYFVNSVKTLIKA
jgi:multisubunit Na+/H+ antiporter MnhE subunit